MLEGENNTDTDTAPKMIQDDMGKTMQDALNFFEEVNFKQYQKTLTGDPDAGSVFCFSRSQERKVDQQPGGIADDDRPELETSFLP